MNRRRVDAVAGPVDDVVPLSDHPAFPPALGRWELLAFLPDQNEGAHEVRDLVALEAAATELSGGEGELLQQHDVFFNSPKAFNDFNIRPRCESKCSISNP